MRGGHSRSTKERSILRDDGVLTRDIFVAVINLKLITCIKSESIFALNKI